MPDAPLLEEVQLYEGLWWVPGTPDQKLFGALFIGSDGLTLRLKVPEGYAKATMKPLKVVHGTDQHGKLVTLFYSTNVCNFAQGAVTSLIYSVGYCFHGAHFLKWSEVIFDEAEVDYQYLQDWIDISGFISRDSKGTGAVIQYELPDDLVFSCSNEFTLTFVPKVTTYLERGDFGSIRQQWSIRLRYKKLQPFKRIREDLLAVRRFLTLGVGCNVVQRSLILGQTKFDLRIGRKRLRHDIISHTRSMHSSLTSARKHSHVMPFSFGSIRNDFEAIFSKWLAYHKSVTDSLHLFFSTIENGHLYSNHIILFLAQALEVYHRSLPTRFSSSIESKSNIKQRLERLTAGLSKADAKWLRAALAFSNQLTLNMRLMEIFREKRKFLGEFLAPEELFAERIRHTRNHFTHWGEKKGRNVVSDEEMFPLIHQLRVVLKVCFLSDIGMPDHIVNRLVRKFSWTVVNFTEDDTDEQQTHPTAALPPAKKRASRQNK